MKIGSHAFLAEEFYFCLYNLVQKVMLDNSELIILIPI